MTWITMSDRRCPQPGCFRYLPIEGRCLCATPEPALDRLDAARCVEVTPGKEPPACPSYFPM